MTTPIPSYDELRQKYIEIKLKEQLAIEPKTTILDQIHNYKYSENNYLVKQLSEELKQQKKLNEMLKMENNKKEIETIEKFVSTHEKEVFEQLPRLEEITTQLKIICEENTKLENEKEELQEIIHSDKYNELANKMRKIKKVKNDILCFLEKQGIHSPF